MKKLSTLIAVLITSVSAWAQQPDAVGYSKTNVDFTKYKTFTWAKSDVTTVGPNGYEIYYYELQPDQNKHKDHNMSHNSDHKKAKNKSAKAKTTEPASEEAYVYSYSVIIPAKEQSSNTVLNNAITNELEGRGYRESDSGGDLIVAYQVLDRRAVLHGYTNDQPEIAGGREVRTPSDTTSFVLEPGSLIVTLVDAKTSQVVWDGYTTGMNNNDLFITDEVELKEAVHKIFEEFKYTADKARRN